MSALLDLSESLSDAVSGVLPSVVSLRGRRFAGSGVAVGPERVVTAARGLPDVVRVGLPSGRVVEGRVVGRDRGTGLALVDVPGAALPEAPLGSGLPRLGAIVLVLGRGERPGVAWGLVSDVGPAWTTPTGGHVDGWIDVDASLPWGFPGGPLVDAAGAVVGVNVRDLVRGGTSLPISTVLGAVARLGARGSRDPGYLGVGAVPATLTAAQADAAGQSDGLLLVSVEADGPAAAGGLVVGDVLLAVDGQAVATLGGLQGRLADLGAGHEATLRVLSGGSVREASVTLGRRG